MYVGTFDAAQLAFGADSVGTATGVYGLPGLGLRISSTLSSPVIILAVQGLVAPDTDASNRFRSIAFPGEGTYSETVDQYRVVSMSAWLEYQGATLTDGGQASGIMYRGGAAPFPVGLWDYAKVAETPGGYQGAVRDGTYSFWMPSNERDMLFRDLGSSERWALPYIVFSGLMASPDIPNVLRLRVPTNFELVSTSQIYSYKHAVISPEMITHAVLVVSTMDTTMENPGHWDKIKEILGEGVQTALNAGAFLARNWEAIAGAAAALGVAAL